MSDAKKTDPQPSPVTKLDAVPKVRNTKSKKATDEKPRSDERLQKVIARAGVASRRAAEELITEGKVSVNGHVITELGTRADPQTDNIVVEGRPLQMPSGAKTVVLLHKPKGVMTTRSDPEGRPTVLNLLPRDWQRLHPIGRLDYDTAGVLLLTDDGELTHALTHPSHQVEKVYQVRVRGKVEEKTIQRLRRGVKLEDGPTSPCHVRIKAQTDTNTLLEIALREGRNRQVRRMMEAVGHLVSSLRRVRFAGVELEGLPPGEYRELLPVEVSQLRKYREKTKTASSEKPAGSKRRASTPPRSRAPFGQEAGKGKAASSATSRPARSRAAESTPASSSRKKPSSRPARSSGQDKASPLAQRINKKWRQTEE